jgi:hypothetical protein
VDGLVARDVKVGGAARELQLVLPRDTYVALVVAAGGRGDVGLPAADRLHRLRLADGLLTPAAGDDKVGGHVRPEEVHRDLREGHRRAALHEEDVPRVERRPEKLGNERGRLVVDLLVDLAAMAVLHDAHAGLVEVQELLSCSLES